MKCLLGFFEEILDASAYIYLSLRNLFQLVTVVYHQLELKDMFPRDMNWLSLLSGIGGAEVALPQAWYSPE